MPSLRLFLAALVVLSCDSSTSPQWRVYRVGEETLSHVALKTGVSVARLRNVNHLHSDAIHWGAGLLVPETEKTLALPRWKPPRPGPDWQPCAQVDWVPVVPSEPDERCLRKACAGEACMCLTTADELAVEVSLGPASWPSTMFPMSDPAAFRHARVDLDGDGAPESVVSVREGVSNGLCIHRFVVGFGSAPAEIAFDLRRYDINDLNPIISVTIRYLFSMTVAVIPSCSRSSQCRCENGSCVKRHTGGKAIPEYHTYFHQHSGA